MEKLKKALYLDDVRTPTKDIPGYEPWIVVRNYEEFVKYITDNEIPDYISFDHDLGEEHMNDYALQVSKMGWQAPDYENYKEKTGLDCAKWLCDYINYFTLHGEKAFPICGVHSHNPVGATNIKEYINGYMKHIGLEPTCFMSKPEFKI
jgi:hypothetical protein